MGYLSSNVLCSFPRNLRDKAILSLSMRGQLELIHPTMMSEEEVDGNFKVCRQEWRSDTFNNFMERLD